MYRIVKTHLRAESGIVLPVSVIVLFVITLLMIAVGVAALNTSQGARTQQYRNGALAAADAGLQAADYRLTAAAQNNPSAVDNSSLPCFTLPSAANTAATATGCTPESESFGTHGSYKYWATMLSSGNASSCTGWPVTSTTLFQYCITSLGTYDGVTRRVEERVVAQPALFPVNGILTVGSISSTNTLEMTGNLASNSGSISLSNSSVVNGTISVVPPNTISAGSGVCGSTCTENTSATVAPFSFPDGKFATAYNNNNDSLLANTATNITNNTSWGSGCTSMPTSGTNAYDMTCSGTVGSSSSPVLLKAGNYYFCNFSASQTIWLKETSGPVDIYLDSPARPGSICNATTGPGSVTSGSTTATSSTIFTGGANYVGKTISDQLGGIPSGTTITAENNSTSTVGSLPAHSATMSQAASATEGTSGGGDTLIVQGAITNSGAFSVTNGFNVDNTTGDPSQLEIFGYGCPSCSSSTQPTFKVTNGTTFTGNISIPNSQFVWTNGTNTGVDISGSLVAGSVTNTNSLHWNGSGGGNQTGWVFSPTAWGECPSAQTSSSDPNSGCY